MRVFLEADSNKDGKIGLAHSQRKHMSTKHGIGASEFQQFCVVRVQKLRDIYDSYDLGTNTSACTHTHTHTHTHTLIAHTCAHACTTNTTVLDKSGSLDSLELKALIGELGMQASFTSSTLKIQKTILMITITQT